MSYLKLRQFVRYVAKTFLQMRWLVRNVEPITSRAGAKTLIFAMEPIFRTKNSTTMKGLCVRFHWLRTSLARE